MLLFHHNLDAIFHLAQFLNFKSYFKFILDPALPIAIIILPQLGSSPAIAVLTNGELAIERAICFASISDLHFLTLTVTNFEDPSPSETTLFARFNKTLFKALSKF